MATDYIDETAAFDLRAYSKTADAQDMDDARDAIITHLWPSSDPFARTPDSVLGWNTYGAMTSFPGGGSYTKVNSPHRIVYLCFDMAKGIKCRAVYFPALDSAFSGRLVVFHQGHNTAFTAEETNVLLQANAEGDDLLICYMPLLGPNTVDTADPDWPGTTVRVGTNFATHDDLTPFADSSFNPLSYFIEPVIGSINHVSTLRTYTRIGMVGISGGGWTTVLASALDRRIDRSYCVAGSWPRRWWSSPSLYDYEQKLPGISEESSPAGGGDYVRYTDLWLMACYPSPRRHRLVYNRYDPSCFPGGNSAELRPQLKAMADERGCGFVEVNIDATIATHTISTAARTQWIFPDFTA